MKAALVADLADRDAGLLGDYLQQIDATTTHLDRANLRLDGVQADVLILLGSNRSVHDPAESAVVASEINAIRRSLADGIPVMGICYGAQVLARALGGDSKRGHLPECGWTEVFSNDEDLCPPGYWAQMHHDVFIPAETSTVTGWSPAGPQAFIDNSRGAAAIGWQFHPELTVETLTRWLDNRYSGSEYAEAAVTLDAARWHAPLTAPRAFTLFDLAFRFLANPGR